MRAAGQVVDDGRSGVLHDHVAGLGAVLVADQEGRQAVVGGRIDQLVEAALGNRGQHRDRRLQVAHRQRQRHAVEMAGGNHLLLDMLGLLVGKHQRIVGDRIEFDVEHALGLLQRIAHRAVHLRDAAQRIAVLRLVLLAAAERQEALVELLAAMALAERHPVPADVEAQRLRGGVSQLRRQPLPEARHQVIGDVGPA
jgi:hypothetical protein